MSAPIFSEWFHITKKPKLPGYYDIGVGSVIPLNPSNEPKYWDGNVWRLKKDGEVSLINGFGGIWWRGLRKWVLVRPHNPIINGNGYISNISRQTVEITGRIEYAKTFDSALEALQYRDRNDCCRQEQDFQAVLV